MRNSLQTAGFLLVVTMMIAPAFADTGKMAAMESGVADNALTYRGTGFFVDWRGHILTAHHVVAECSSVEIFGSGHQEAAVVIASSETDDLSLLEVPETFGEPLGFDRRDHLPGGSLVAITGYAVLEQAAAASENHDRGIIANAMVIDEATPRHIALVSDAKPGSSGSPVIDSAGLVAGIVESRVTRDGGNAYSGHVRDIRLAVSAAAAREFLDGQGVDSLASAPSDRRHRPPIALAAAAEVRVDCHR